MRTRPTILYFSPDANPVPPLVEQWAQSNGFPLHVFRRPDDVESIVLRGHPSLLFVDGNAAGDTGLALVVRGNLETLGGGGIEQQRQPGVGLGALAPP